MLRATRKETEDMTRSNAIRLGMLLALTGCAGMTRECNGCWTEATGANWLVTQLEMNGEIRNCWQLKGLALANEPHSDGIWWVADGQQIHISGWYNFVQVQDWNVAASTLGVNLTQCTGGRYRTLDEVKKVER
jgi:hypothetical protein